MRPILYWANQMEKRRRKKHHIPETMVLTEEQICQFREDNKNRDNNCFTVDEKLQAGLQLEQVALPNCGAWHISMAGNPDDRVLYYIHGGGFVFGNTRGTFHFISYAVKHFGCNMFSIDYRLAPDYHCIDSVSDCEDGYRQLLEKYAPEKIILIGDSAGGNLVFSLCHKLRADGLPLPGGIISCSPVLQFLHYAYSYYECSCKTDYGITFGINSVLRIYQGDLPLDHPLLSPLLGDLSNFPPVYLDASSCESLRDEARMMYVRLKEEGSYVEYHELKDFFHAMLTNERFRFVRKEEYPHIIRFIQRVFAGELIGNDDQATS